jgi:hypothetical protein
MIDFFTSEFIKDFYIDIRGKERTLRIELEDFIKELDFLSHKLYMIFYKILVKDIIITLYLNKEIEEKKVNEIIEKIEEEKLKMDIKYFGCEIALDNFIDEEFTKNGKIVYIKFRHIEELGKEIVEEYFKRIKNVLEKYYKEGV